MKKILYYDEQRRATWLELFFDLVFVVLIGKATHLLSYGHISIDNIIKFLLVFIPIWWIWADHTMYNNIYDIEGRVQRIMTLIIMLLIIGLSIFIDDDFDKGYLGFITFFTAIRFIIGFLYLKFSNVHKGCKRHSLAKGKTYLFTAFIGVTSFFFPLPYRYFVVYLSILMDFILGIYLERSFPHFKAHIGHLLERTGLLIIILLGESVISIVGALSKVDWSINNIIASISGFALIGGFWWIHFDSFDLLENSKKFRKPYVILIPHFLLCMGLSIIANIIRYAILDELSLENFKFLLLVGLTLFYIGKLIPYTIALPEARKQQFMNTTIVFILTGFSLYLSKVELIMVAASLIMFIHIYLNYKYILNK